MLYLLDFGKDDKAGYASDSETHANIRYTVAEKLQNELKG